MINKRDNHEKALSVQEMYKSLRGDLRLKLIAGKAGVNKEITHPIIQKPGLRLTGVSDLQQHRVQVFGLSEGKYLAFLSKGDLKGLLRLFRSKAIPCMVFSKGAGIPSALKELAEEEYIPLFKTALSAAPFIDKLNKYLEDRLAPNAIIHGVLMDVLGIGIIITGKSGIGKSECALDLVSKGHRLVADDVIVIKKKGSAILVGSPSDVTKYHMEVRGLGILNIKDLFGITAIREKKQVDIIVELVQWDDKDYDRLGFTENFMSLLGISLPLFSIPLSPGRSIATLIEVAARNHIIKIMGKHPAKEFEKHIHRTISIEKRRFQTRPKSASDSDSMSGRQPESKQIKSR
jgi:HPr kinase/phosphorylase